MLELNIYSYIQETNFQFYKTKKVLVKKMDVLDWLLGSYQEEIVEEGENPLDRARYYLLAKTAQNAPVVDLSLLLQCILAIRLGGRQ